ncbi:MAG: alpha/beta hydrolase [Proteobacteria bacterium]|nr:alpha/beta hydrolase [Pseudomonadota bacterium]MCP4916216.1 alpha/beta hydrolase [Pseudomonadota bacterium]
MSAAHHLCRLLGAVLPTERRDGLELDPDLRGLFAIQNRMPGLWNFPPAEARRRAGKSGKLSRPLGVPQVETTDLDWDLPLRRYTPPDARGGWVYFHGGGFVLGDLRSHDTICQRLAAASGRTLVAVDYRLAPEHPFPAAVDDGLAAWNHLAPLLGDDVVVGGDSAGGNLAAVVAQARPSVRPSRQILIYPATDRGSTLPSVDRFSEGLLLTRAFSDWFMEHYLQGADVKDPRVSPLFGELHDLPPSEVLVAGWDPLRDEGIAYHEALLAAGSSSTLTRFDTMPHGFMQLAGASRGASAALDEIGRLAR